MDQHQQILTVMQDIRNNNPELYKCGGLGYCGYGSKLVSDKLRQLSIEHKIVMGEYVNLDDGANGLEWALSQKEVVSKIKDNEGRYANMKRVYEHKDPKDFGKVVHIAIEVDDTIYDVTSEQFKLPETYSKERFYKAWYNIYYVELAIKSEEFTYFRTVATSKKLIQSSKVISTESHITQYW